MVQASKTSDNSPSAVGQSYPEQSLSDQVAILKSDFKDFAATLEGMIREQKAELTKLGAKKADEAMSLATTAAANVGDSAAHARDTTVEAIRQRPLTALAVSAGIGLLVGMLSSRNH